MIWDDQSIGQLRQLWAEGHSTAEIGRRLCCSKNSIVGKAHRLDLDERPSSIRRLPGSYIKPPPSVPRVLPALPPLESDMPRAVVRPQIVAPPSPPATVFRARRVVSCCWPIGEPGTRTFRFCDDAAAAGKSYCDQHAKLAFVTIRDRKEDAA